MCVCRAEHMIKRAPSRRSILVAAYDTVSYRIKSVKNNGTNIDEYSGNRTLGFFLFFKFLNCNISEMNTVVFQKNYEKFLSKNQNRYLNIICIGIKIDIYIES